MEGVRRGLPWTGPALALAALGAAANLVSAALFSQAAPSVDFLDLMRIALPGVSLAGAAGVLVVLGRAGIAPLALGVASFAVAAPPLAVGLQQRSGAWVAIGACGLALVPALVVTALSFPDGRLAGHAPRIAAAAAVAAGAACVVVGAVSYDPATWAWCRCVTNPLAVADVAPSSYGHVADVLTAIEAATAGAGLVVFVLTRSWRRPSGVQLAFGGVFAVVAACWIVIDAWAVLTTDTAPSWLGVVRDIALVLLPVTYVAGFAAQRPSRAHVADLLLAAREGHEPHRLQELVARAVGDPGTLVAWWDPVSGTFRDHLYRPVDVSERNALPVESAGRPIAVVLSDRLGSVDAAVRESVAEALLLSAENRRLTAELQASLDQVKDSRARILTASDETRRRLERDLHDGAQQLLISTGIKLNLATTHAEHGDSRELADALAVASEQLNHALAELRNLAGGIAPTALVHGSLANALRELALRSPVPTTVRVSEDGEPDARVGSTVYFVVAECLTNVAKHATATHATVHVELGEPVRVTITDDGTGGARLDGDGTGLRGLVDRVEAHGGRLEVTSDSGGTQVLAILPGDEEAR